MKTKTLKWVIGIMTIMFVFASSAWAHGNKGKGHGHKGSKYQQRHYKDNAHDYKYRGQDKRHHRHGKWRARHQHGPRYYYYDDHRPRHRHHVKERRGRIRPNPIFWLFPFPPLKPFVYE